MTNINANVWLRQRNLSPDLELPLTCFHRSLYVDKLHATTSQMQATSLPQHFVIMIKSRKQILNHYILQKVNEVLHYKGCQFRPSVSTKFLRIDLTKYSCVQFDVQFSTCSKQTMNVFLHCSLAWICVDFSCKTAFIRYHVMTQVAQAHYESPEQHYLT